jgi:hypothetical protein
MNVQPLPIPFSELHVNLQCLHNALKQYSVFKSAVAIKFQPDGCSASFDTLTMGEIAQLSVCASLCELLFCFIAGKDAIIVRFYLS